MLLLGVLAEGDAERLAVTRYGRPDVVAVAFAHNGRGAAVPTTFTRLSGLAAMVAPGPFIVGLLAVLADAPDAVHWAGGVLIAAAIGCLLVAVVGLGRRHGPTLGSGGRAARWVAFLAFPLSLPFGWAAPLALAGFLGLSLALLAAGMLRAGVVPRPAVVLLVLGIPAGLAVGQAGTLLGVDTSPFVAPVGVPIVSAGLVVIGWRLWREHAVGAGPRQAAPA